MAKVAGMSGADAATEASSLQLVEKETHAWAEGGEFLPLGVWGARGFNEDMIRERTPKADIRQDTVLGCCYRVKIMSVTASGSREMVSTSKLSVAGTRSATDEKDDVGGSGKRAVLAIKDGKAASSSSSSSSSSSDKKRKSKKSKKHKSKKDKKKDKKDKKDKSGGKRGASSRLQDSNPASQRMRAFVFRYSGVSAAIGKYSGPSRPLLLLVLFVNIAAHHGRFYYYCYWQI